MTTKVMCPECGASYGNIQEPSLERGVVCSRCRRGPKIRSVGKEREGSSSFRQAPKIVYPELRAPKIFCSPKPCPRLTGWPGGININRKDRNLLKYQEILLISILLSSEHPKNRLRMLFFIRDCKRPFVVESHTIQYPDFPHVRALTSIASLRNLLLFLVNRNPEIILDNNTYNWGLGFHPKRLEGDVDSLSTALVGILESESHFAESISG